MTDRRILHLLPRCIGGGPERSVVALAHEMRALGRSDRHTIVVIDPPVTPAMLMATRRAGIALVTRADDEVLQRLTAESDLVVLHFWNHPALHELLSQTLLPPCRVLVVAHVLGLEAPQVLTTDVADFADALIVTSHVSLDSDGARWMTADGGVVEVLPAVLDRHRLATFTPREHTGIVVGYLGSLNHTKLHERFVELCAQVTHPAVRFLVYGSGGDPVALQRRFDEAGLGGRAEVRGPVEDIAAALSGMDIFGYPLCAGTSATSDRALQEAMWVGLPVVVLPSSAPSSMVDHDLSGLVVDEADYPTAIDRLAGDAGLRARLGSGARSHAIRAFDPVPATHRFTALIDHLCAADRRSRSPLAGNGESAAGRFVRSLGSAAGPLAVSLGVAPGDQAAADQQIAASPTVLAHAEGGIVHYRNVYPDDPHLRLWSGLVAHHHGDHTLAAAEFASAAALGLEDGRAERYADEVRPGPGR